MIHSRRHESLFDRVAASPAAFQIAAGALVAAGVWAVAVIFWGL
jgi:hypothetical protein